MKAPKLLVLLTLTALIVGTFCLFYFSRPQTPKALPISASGHPTIGSSAAEVDVVIFEDPKCLSCKKFNDFIFPELEKNYIATEKIRFTSIPVSVIKDSVAGGNALLCVYHQAPLYPNSDLYFKYLKSLFANQNETWTDKRLLQIASDSDVTINLPKLRSCTQKHKWDAKIVKNTQYGKDLLGKNFKTPTVFVDGVRVKDLTEVNLFNSIDAALKEKGEKK